MICTIAKHTDKNLSIQYGRVNLASTGLEWITYADISQEDMKKIEMLQGNVQEEINKILLEYVNSY